MQPIASITLTLVKYLIYSKSFMATTNGLISVAKPVNRISLYEKHGVDRLDAFKTSECDDSIDLSNDMLTSDPARIG